MKVSTLLIMIAFLAGSNPDFDLKSYSNHEMKIYKKTSKEKIEPPAQKTDDIFLFQEWNTIIQSHSRDKMYEHFHKKKKRYK